MNSLPWKIKLLKMIIFSPWKSKGRKITFRLKAKEPFMRFHTVHPLQMSNQLWCAKLFKDYFLWDLYIPFASKSHTKRGPNRTGPFWRKQRWLLTQKSAKLRDFSRVFKKFKKSISKCSVYLTLTVWDCWPFVSCVGWGRSSSSWLISPS